MSVRISVTNRRALFVIIGLCIQKNFHLLTFLHPLKPNFALLINLLSHWWCGCRNCLQLLHRIRLICLHTTGHIADDACSYACFARGARCRFVPFQQGMRKFDCFFSIPILSIKLGMVLVWGRRNLVCAVIELVKILSQILLSLVSWRSLSNRARIIGLPNGPKRWTRIHDVLLCGRHQV